jgi:hypothetical protein
MTLYYSIKRAFENCGVTVDGIPALLDEEMMVEFCREFRPDAVLEINRTRRQTPWLDRNIKHIAWMFDLGEWNYDDLGDSEIIYFFGANWKVGYDNNKNCKMFTDFMPPGMDSALYNYSKKEKLSDFSFLGHIPAPWSNDELSRIIVKNNNKKLSFGELSLECRRQWESISLENYDNRLYLESAIKIVNNLVGPNEFMADDKKIRYDLSCRIVRQMNRSNLIDLVLENYTSLRIYGTKTWSQYKRYKVYYNKYISSPIDIKELFQTSRINLHEGVGLHDRTFSILGSGGFLFYKKSPDDDKYGGINTFFEPYKHYIPFNDNDFLYLSKKYLQDKAKRKSISVNASKLVHDNHKWSDRTRKIINDLKSG